MRSVALNSGLAQALHPAAAKTLGTRVGPVTDDEAMLVDRQLAGAGTGIGFTVTTDPRAFADDPQDRAFRIPQIVANPVARSRAAAWRYRVADCNTTEVL